jgi:enamine deaminase RidA (YjgF/YER057c/UK114 family)
VEKRVINPWTWQDRFGFVQAAELTGAERVLHCAGQTSVDENGQPLHEGQMEAQALQALDNLETVLREAGFELADMVRLTFYVTDVDTYRETAAPALGARLGQAGCRHAATLVGVTRLALPELLIELEATAVK